MALIRLNNQSLSAVSALPAGVGGKVLQVKQALSNTRAVKSSVTFVDTELFAGITFDNNLQANSKVFATIEATIGEQNSGSWAKPCELTLYEGATNIGNDSHSGVVGSLAIVNGNSGNDTYGMERVYGSILYTPSSTNPSYKLYLKTVGTVAFNRTVGASYNTGTTDYTVGGTRITLMEIAG